MANKNMNMASFSGPPRADKNGRDQDAAQASSGDGSMTSMPPHSERLTDYLSGNFRPPKPLRHEKVTQRNKAVVIAIFVLLVLLWVIYQIADMW